MLPHIQNCFLEKNAVAYRHLCLEVGCPSIKSPQFPNNLPSMAVAPLVSKACALPSMSKMKAKSSRLSSCSTIQNLCSSISNSSSQRSDFQGALSERHAFPKALKNLFSDKVGSCLLSHSEFDYVELHSNVIASVYFQWLLQEKKVSNLEIYLLFNSVSDMEIGKINISLYCSLSYM